MSYRKRTPPNRQICNVGAEEERFLMPSVEYGRFGLQPAAVTCRKQQIQREPKKRKPRQEICAPLKWLCFIVNFLVFLIGVTCLALGVYLCVKDPRAIGEWADIFLNPAIMLTIIGLAVCIVSLMGSLGALRDNITLLKTFALSVFFCYVVIVVFTFFLFILFYSDTTEGLSAHSILLYSIKKYHTNRNLADFVDYVQEQLECCGASSVSQGYRDWQLSDQFNCSSTNPYPEKCGVPFSCCRRSVISEAVGSSNPLLPAMRSLECWQNAQTKRAQDLEAELHTRGCLQPLRVLFESHAVYIGAIVAAIIVPVCISVCLSNILAKQIDHQHYLLEREARRCERRRRRERHRFRDPFAACDNLERGVISSSLAAPKGAEKKALADEMSKEPSSVPDWRTSANVTTGANANITASAVSRLERGDVQPKKYRQHRAAASSSPRRAAQVSANFTPSRGVSVESALAHKRGREKKRRSTVPPMTAEDRTHQWVLQQPDPISHESVS
uniref:Tetraspanin n=1 Tax=Parascaris univalens TaxID=6257 RepID=A0A915AYJ6_PARUN